MIIDFHTFCPTCYCCQIRFNGLVFPLIGIVPKTGYQQLNKFNEVFFVLSTLSLFIISSIIVNVWFVRYRFQLKLSSMPDAPSNLSTILLVMGSATGVLIRIEIGILECQRVKLRKSCYLRVIVAKAVAVTAQVGIVYELFVVVQVPVVKL